MTKSNLTIKIQGMTCNHCSNFVKMTLEETKGVLNSEVSWEKGEALVEFDAEQTNEQSLKNAIDETHFSTVDA